MRVPRIVPFAVVALMLVTGALTLTASQTQQLFRDSAVALESGRLPRNDGAIAFAAVMIGAGLALLVALGSSLPLRERWLPALGLAVSAGALVVIHFTIFVNGVILSNYTVASFTASFAFHASQFVPVFALFFVALVSTLLIGGLVWASWRLVGPTSLGAHLGAKASPTALRNHVLLTGLFFVATLLFFSGAFLETAIDLEATDDAGRYANLVLLYYLLILAILLLVLVLAAKTALLVWRHRWFQHVAQPARVFSSLGAAEFVLLAIVVGLNLLVLAVYPDGKGGVDPRLRGDLVFVYTDEGLSFLFMLGLTTYLVFTTASRSARRTLLGPIREYNPSPWDANATFALFALGGAALFASPLVELGNLPRFIAAVSFLAVLVGVRAFRFGLRDGVPSAVLRKEGGPFAVAFLALSWVAALMLWGMGNTLEATYMRDGDLVRLTDTHLQGFAIAYRFVGSVFFAIPAVLGLDAATKWRSTRKLGPLVLVLFGLLVGAHMLFPVAYETPFDADLGTTDVLVGFATVAQAQLTRNVVVVVWSALAFATILATMRVLTAGRPTKST